MKAVKLTAVLGQMDGEEGTSWIIGPRLSRPIVTEVAPLQPALSLRSEYTCGSVGVVTVGNVKIFGVAALVAVPTIMVVFGGAGPIRVSRVPVPPVVVKVIDVPGQIE